MSLTTEIESASAAVKSVKFDSPAERDEFDFLLNRDLKAGHPLEMAEGFAVYGIMHDAGELGDRYDNAHTALRHWLFFVKSIRDPEPLVTPELFAEWRAARDGYKAKLEQRPNGCYLATPEWLGRIDYTRREPPFDQRERAAGEIANWKKSIIETEAGKVREKAALAEGIKQMEARRTRVARAIAYLQPLVIPSPDLNPVNWQELHKLKKHSQKSKRDLVQRWCERFEALPDNVQHAWRAFYNSTLFTSPIVDDVRESADDDDGEDETPAAAASYSQLVYLTPYPLGKRDIHDGNAEVALAGVSDPAFRAFMPFSEGVRRLLELIGNPLDDVILPPRDDYAPEPAQDVDDIEPDADSADIVPGFIPRGLSVFHGDAKATKSLLLQKASIVVADDTGATFEGIEVDHGQVIYATHDPGATTKRIKPGVVEIRDRLGLKPSGRLYLTDAPLILNEPASVAHWIELQQRDRRPDGAQRLPAKMIVVDSLFSTSVGSLAQDSVMQGVCEGLKALLRHAAAVVIVHHDNKSGEIFGSQFLNAMMIGKTHVVRSAKNGVLGDHVAVTVEFLKFADAELKLEYRLDGPFLDAGESAGKGKVSAGPVKRADVLALLETAWTPLKGLRAAINAKLADHVVKLDEKTWNRLRHGWQAAGRIEQDGNRIRRM